MWFLIKNLRGDPTWETVRIYGEINISKIKQDYRKYGIPIIAIARCKPVEPYDYED